jgi:hypothetical protein
MTAVPAVGTEGAAMTSERAARPGLRSTGSLRPERRGKAARQGPLAAVPEARPSMGPLAAVPEARP